MAKDRLRNKRESKEEEKSVGETINVKTVRQTFLPFVLHIFCFFSWRLSRRLSFTCNKHDSRDGIYTSRGVSLGHRVGEAAFLALKSVVGTQGINLNNSAAENCWRMKSISTSKFPVSIISGRMHRVCRTGAVCMGLATTERTGMEWEIMGLYPLKKSMEWNGHCVFCFVTVCIVQWLPVVSVGCLLLFWYFFPQPVCRLVFAYVIREPNIVLGI